MQKKTKDKRLYCVTPGCTFEGKLPEGLLPDAVEDVVRTAELTDALRGQGE